MSRGLHGIYREYIGTGRSPDVTTSNRSEYQALDVHLILIVSRCAKRYMSCVIVCPPSCHSLKVNGSMFAMLHGGGGWRGDGKGYALFG
jgi:hypothetical protein